MRLASRGMIKEGNWADVVIFDYDKIQDRATYEKPLLTPGRDRSRSGERPGRYRERKAYGRPSRQSALRAGPRVMSVASVSSIDIREVDSVAEIRQVEELQRIVWGIPDIEVVPLSQLMAARSSGGVLLGAFDGESMAGFAYGFVGLEHGRTVHHSHMLAVRKEYRKHDLGFRLKAAQREYVLAQGIERMTWTFDPLQSLNAHFNFGKLGVVSNKYYINYYGEEAASFLHQNGTDRLWVTWLLKTERVIEKLKGHLASAIPDGVHVLVELGERMRAGRRRNAGVTFRGNRRHRDTVRYQFAGTSGPRTRPPVAARQREMPLRGQLKPDLLSRIFAAQAVPTGPAASMFSAKTSS